ncbi:hypothetical protein M514_00358 [Trichuris suis]|uniref:Uncharacterized protein n=1 Tax=Trichuris suis TaxID=68888 RepID=A0A085NGN0_9BILA|nr:hypothetical protein M513_00358 [Trichuris suis]KFD68626.1 hypothetical protein M514_00358 [Trichuris suis]
MNRNDDYEDRRIAHRRQVYIAFVLKFFIDTTVIQSARLIYSLERQGQNSTHYIRLLLSLPLYNVPSFTALSFDLSEAQRLIHTAKVSILINALNITSIRLLTLNILPRCQNTECCRPDDSDIDKTASRKRLLVHVDCLRLEAQRPLFYGSIPLFWNKKSFIVLLNLSGSAVTCSQRITRENQFLFKIPVHYGFVHFMDAQLQKRLYTAALKIDVISHDILAISMTPKHSLEEATLRPYNVKAKEGTLGYKCDYLSRRLNWIVETEVSMTAKCVLLHSSFVAKSSCDFRVSQVQFGAKRSHFEESMRKYHNPVMNCMPRWHI